MNINNLKNFIIAGTIILLTSCEGFLDEVDQDKLIPEKPEHYAALLLNEFNAEFPIFDNIEYMTDNMSEISSMTSEQKADPKSTYTWQREIELDEDGEKIYVNQAWQDIYEDIAITNYVIELIDESDGEQEDKDYVKGEAYFIRAFSYFNLLNLYGIPYNESTANTDLGVPLRTDLSVEAVYYRNTVAECYEQIEQDLNNAISLIESSQIEKSIWHPDTSACNLLMSRIMLYQEKWQEAIDYASKVIDNESLARMTSSQSFITENNAEVLYSFYTVSPILMLYSSGTTFNSFAYYASDELYNLYDTLDIRKEAFFAIQEIGPNDYPHTTKYSSGTYTDLGYANFRVAEAYLNRAEAYAKLNQPADAISDMEVLLSKRYTNTSGIVYPSETDEVLDFVLTERRKELCFEEHHRWFDLRRMADRPEIVHYFTLVNSEGVEYGIEAYTLFPDDLNYTLPIPLEERDNNPLIRNNERYDKLPETTDIIVF